MNEEEIHQKTSEFLKKIIGGASSNMKIDLNEVEEQIRGDFIEFAEYANVSK